MALNLLACCCRYCRRRCCCFLILSFVPFTVPVYLILTCTNIYTMLFLILKCFGRTLFRLNDTRGVYSWIGLCQSDRTWIHVPYIVTFSFIFVNWILFWHSHLIINISITDDCVRMTDTLLIYTTVFVFNLETMWPLPLSIILKYRVLINHFCSVSLVPPTSPCMYYQKQILGHLNFLLVTISLEDKTLCNLPLPGRELIRIITWWTISIVNCFGILF